MMRKHHRLLAFIALASLVLTIFSACGKTEQASDNKQASQVVVNDATFSLSDGWTYDEEYASFSRGDTIVRVENEIIDECESAEARLELSKQYADEGIDCEALSVNGTDAVYTEEPVNEIMYCCFYYYIDGKEHELSIETDFDSYEKSKESIISFLSNITW